MNVMRGDISRRSLIIVMALASPFFLHGIPQNNQFAAHAESELVKSDALSISSSSEPISSDEYRIYAALTKTITRIEGSGRTVYWKVMTDVIPADGTNHQARSGVSNPDFRGRSLPTAGTARGLIVPASIWIEMKKKSFKSYKLDHAPEVEGLVILLTADDQLPNGVKPYLASPTVHALAFSRAGFDSARTVAMVQWTDQCADHRCLPVTSILRRDGDAWTQVTYESIDRSQVPRLDRSRLPNVDQFYPEISRRLGEIGVVITRVLVVPDGRVIAAEVENPSIHIRLDTAAIELAKTLHFLPLSTDQVLSTTYQVDFPANSVRPILEDDESNWTYIGDQTDSHSKAPRLDSANVPALDHFYPPISKRLGEEGTVVARVTVDPDGHVLDAQIAKSSGFARLDAAAIEYVQKMLHFYPFSANKPASTLYKIEFKLSPAPPPQQ